MLYFRFERTSSGYPHTSPLCLCTAVSTIILILLYKSFPFLFYLDTGALHLHFVQIKSHLRVAYFYVHCRCDKLLEGTSQMVTVVLGGIMRVLVVESGISGRSMHHLLFAHHVTHRTVRTVRSTGTCVRRKYCSIRLVNHRLYYPPPRIYEPVINLKYRKARILR